MLIICHIKKVMYRVQIYLYNYSVNYMKSENPQVLARVARQLTGRLPTHGVVGYGI